MSRNVLVTLLCCFVLAGCGQKHLKNPSEPGAALLYGFIDLQSADVPLDWLTLKKTWPPSKKPYYYAGCDGEGLFWHYNATKGAYQVIKFGESRKFFRGGDILYTYDLGEIGSNETSMEVTGPGLYFVGAFKKNTTRSANMFVPGEFELVRVERPSEKHVLKMLLPLSKGTQWESMIESRIRELSK